MTRHDAGKSAKGSPRASSTGQQKAQQKTQSNAGQANVGPSASKSSPKAILPAGLYVVATPIGNLGDMTARAIETLKAADVIACEDTRVTGVLLQRFAIATPMTPYHDHNADRVRPQLIARLQAGDVVALVSDAGTPLISDPGYKLVRDCAAAGVATIPLPGPSALLAAAAVAGLPTDRIQFAGFLPSKTGARREALMEFKSLRASLVFYESPQRLAETLADMAAVYGARDVAVCRELTKLHEEVRRGTLGELAATYAAADTPKGEVVIVVGGAQENHAATTEAALDQALRGAMQTMSVRDAAASVAAALNHPRREVYARALTLSKK
jgi:16S rRNA (cytidine1402-2'-O)-methyltransferase